MNAVYVLGIFVIFLAILFFWVVSAVIDENKSIKRDVEELKDRIDDLEGVDETPIEIRASRKY